MGPDQGLSRGSAAIAPDPTSPASDLAGRRLIVGLGGGIACYKLAHVVSALAQGGADVRVAMTDAATRFVTPLTFQALSGRPVYTSQWEHHEASDPQHVALARDAHAMLIAPCTMNLLAKLAHGFTDDVVCLIASVFDLARQPVLLAPSMNARMWSQPATQRNVEQLRADGFHVIEPAEGWQACRTEGPGRLPEPAVLVEALRAALT